MLAASPSCSVDAQPWRSAHTIVHLRRSWNLIKRLQNFNCVSVRLTSEDERRGELWFQHEVTPKPQLLTSTPTLPEEGEAMSARSGGQTAHDSYGVFRLQPLVRPRSATCGALQSNAPRGGNSQRISAPHATAAALGGSGDQGWVTQMSPVTIMRATNAQRPIRSRAELEPR